MVLRSSWIWRSPLPQVAAQATQISTAPVAARPLDTNVAPEFRFLAFIFFCLITNSGSFLKNKINMFISKIKFTLHHLWGTGKST